MRVDDYTLVSNGKEEGVRSAPAIHVWLDAPQKEKWAILQKLRTLGPTGQAAWALLSGKDPRTISYSPEEMVLDGLVHGTSRKKLTDQFLLEMSERE